MKYTLLVLFVMMLSGCATNGDDKAMFREGLAECQSACLNHPNVSAYSIKAGGGIPLLFIGGVEQQCSCRE